MRSGERESERKVRQESRAIYADEKTKCLLNDAKHHVKKSKYICKSFTIILNVASQGSSFVVSGSYTIFVALLQFKKERF